MAKVNQALAAAATRLLRPLVRILLRNGVPYGTFAEWAKRVFADVATQEFSLAYKKQTDSRVSVLTGLSRKEIRQLRETPALDDSHWSEKYNRAARVVSSWVRDPSFAGESGQPADLPFEGAGASFTELVKKYSGDVPARAMLDELLRVGTVELVKGERVRLLARSYVPAGDDSEKVVMMGEDTADLLATFDHNFTHPPEKSFLQLKVVYDNLPAGVLHKLRGLSKEKAQLFLEDLDQWLSSHDRDTNPASEGPGRQRAGVAVYYFEEDLEGGK